MSLIEDIRPQLSEGTVVRSGQRRLRPVLVLVALALVAALSAVTVLVVRDASGSAPTPPGPKVAAPAPDDETTGDDGTGGATADDPAAEGSTSDRTSSGTSSGTSSDRTSSGSSSGTTTKVSAVTTVSAAKAASQLRSAGVTPLGTVRDAMTWTDRNGRNLLVASRSASHRVDEHGMRWESATIRVVHVAGVGTAHPKVLRTMTDPSPECELNFRHDVDTGRRLAEDLDGDGYVEASVAWSSTCAGDPGAGVLAKVALLSNGQKYIWRKTVYPPGQEPADDTRVDLSPAQNAWPEDYFAAVKERFLVLYVD